MTYIKDNYPRDKYEAALKELWVRLWEQHWDLSQPEKMAETLAPFFPEEDIRKILEGAKQPEYKQKLNATTKEALESGAFGCPWYLVTNSEGKKEPFFGSDRFHYMWSFLGVPFQDITIRPKSSL
jgi:glutathione S-transferase kappa 1